MKLEEWRSKHGGIRNYAHFDKRVSLDRVWDYVNNPENVAKHGFYPFIHYTMVFRKYSGNGVKKKEREICYSAHVDRCIFQYYSFLLNQRYNERTQSDGIDGASIAYRDNLGKNNIHFAKAAIDFIKGTERCFVLIGDFTGFFDNLDHLYLKERVGDLLGSDKLPPDYYAVFKNITRYSTWELKDLLKLNDLPNTEKGIQTFKSLDVALSLTDFKSLKNKYVKPHRQSFGIPQGSAISAVLSNIYMLRFDKRINDYVSTKQGLYMRYSDDFIVILPGEDVGEFGNHVRFLTGVVDSIPRLCLEPDKTQVFSYKDGLLLNRNEDILHVSGKGNNTINYLGFSFDGISVSIRDKTISKYYYRLYRKLKTITKNNGMTKKGNRISFENVYLKYSIKGANLGRGNFITYVKRAEEIFRDEPSIGNVRRRHMQKIRKRLDLI